MVKVWLRVAEFVKDEKNLDEAARIMSARVNLEPEEYKLLMKGTFFLDLTGKTPVKYLEYFDGGLLEEAAKK